MEVTFLLPVKKNIDKQNKTKNTFEIGEVSYDNVWCTTIAHDQAREQCNAMVKGNGGAVDLPAIHVF